MPARWLPRAGLRRGLLTALALQVFIISLVAAGSVYAARYVFSEILMRQALTAEARHYLDAARDDPAYPLPRTRNLLAYRSPGTVPEWLAGLADGFNRGVPNPATGARHPVYVTPLPGGRLYLVFSAQNVDRLVLSFGLIPLVAVLCALYLVAFIGYRVAQRAASPVVALARRVAKMRPEHGHATLTLEFPAGEVGALARALDAYGARIADLLDRERRFTGDASHELRTAVTIIAGAAELLAEDPALPPAARERALLIRRAARDLGEVLGVLLLLAREGERGHADAHCEASAIAAAEIAKYRPLLDGKPVTLALEAQEAVHVAAPPQALGIVVGNLVRNACLYTQAGQVTVRVLTGGITVADTGPGIPEAEVARALDGHYRTRGTGGAGSGLGLSIVRRLCERFGWRVELANAPDGGLLASVRFGV